MIRLPDLRRPGHFFEIDNPKSIVAGCHLEYCAICELLKQAVRDQEMRDVMRDLDLVAPAPSVETGFEVV